MQRVRFEMVDLELNNLKREFLAEAKEKVAEMQTSLESGTAESLQRLTWLTHQLKGSGGSYGYARISAEAAALESALEKWTSGNGAGIDPLIRQYVLNLRAEIDRCARELA